jgi:hypothetical protein
MLDDDELKSKIFYVINYLIKQQAMETCEKWKRSLAEPVHKSGTEINPLYLAPY